MIDFIIGGAIVLLIAYTGYRYYKSRKSGGCGCGSGSCGDSSSKQCCSQK